MKFKKSIIILVILYFSLFFCLNDAVANNQDLVPYQQYYIEGARHWVNFMESEDEAELSKAITEFKKAIKENPGFADAYFQLGIIYNIHGEKKEADKMFDKAVEFDPSFKEKIDDINSLKEEQFKPIAIPDIKEFIQGISQDNEKMQSFSEATSLQLEAQCLMFKAMQTQENKYYNQALNKISEAIDIMPEYAGLYTTNAQICIQTEEYKKAEEFLDKAVELDYNYKKLADGMRESMKILSEFSSEEKKICREEFAELTKNISMENDKFLELEEVEKINRQGKLALSKALLGEENKYSEAIEKFESSIAKIPDYTVSYYYLADCYAYQGNFKKAIEILDKAVKVRSDVARGAKNVKVSYEELKMYDEYEFSKYKKERANDYLEELGLREKSPHEDEISHHFIEVMKLLANNEKKGNIDKAIDLLNQIIEWDPSSVQAYFYLGDIYLYWKRSIDKSIEYYKKAIVVDSNYIEAYEGLAYCYEDLGKDKLAQQQWKRILEINPEYEIARERLSE